MLLGRGIGFHEKGLRYTPRALAFHRKCHDGSPALSLVPAFVGRLLPGGGREGCGNALSQVPSRVGFGVRRWFRAPPRETNPRTRPPWTANPGATAPPPGRPKIVPGSPRLRGGSAVALQQK